MPELVSAGEKQKCKRINVIKSKQSSFLILVLVLACTGWYADRSLLQPVVFSGENPDSSNTVLFQIKAGTAFKQLSRQLKRQQLIPSQRAFVIYGLLSGKTDKIKAGEYALTSGMTPVQMLDKFVNGTVTQYSFSIIEGWSFRQLMSAMAEHPALEHDLKDLSDAEIMARLGQKATHPEGRFFADTYTFPKGTSDKDFLQRAFAKMEQVLAEEWSNKDGNLPYKNAYEALIMASIIEKETGLAAERKQIAGVFVRRLQKNMRLQTDPTVIYGLGDQYQGNLTRKHLAQTTPYNTYRIAGLPPTPIAMPGREAIHAALHPAPGSSLYFVAKGDGSHYFSETLAEHSSAVKKYQWQRVENYRSAPK